VVFGQSIGGGIIEAYTAKKVLPRLLIAAILINISIYIVAFAVDVTNILGKGMAGLIEQPFGIGTADALKLHITAADTGSFVAVTGGVLAAFLLGFLVLPGVGELFIGLLFFILIPMLLIMLAIAGTIVFRNGLIVLLVMVSPVAFALYCLPNTEKYFKRWWELLFKALLVYPLIAVMFAMANISSLTIGASTPGVLGPFAKFLAVIALFIPLVLIPFSFRIAGGLIGQIHGLVDNARKVAGQGVGALTKGRKEQWKSDYAAKTIAKRERAYTALNDLGANYNGRGAALVRGGARAGSALAGGYNIKGLMAAKRAQDGKVIADQIASGDDSEIRALTVNKTAALAHGALNAGNKFSNGEMRTENRDGTGRRQFKTLGGRWVNETDVDRGYARWGGNQFAQQAALTHEMGKTITEEDAQNVAQNFHTLAGEGGWNLNNDQMQGVWMGSAYSNQNQHLEYKHMKQANATATTAAAAGALSDQNFVKEMYEKRGSYNLAQMNSNTIEELKNSYRRAMAAPGGPDYNTMQQIESITETFMHDSGMRGVGGMAGGTPVPGGAASADRTVSVPGAGHVAERVRELADITGVLRNAPTGQYIAPTNVRTDSTEHGTEQNH